MCVAQYAHCHNYSKMSLILLLRKVEAQKTELVATRYLPDVVLIEGSDNGIIGIPIKILLLPVLPLGDRNMLVR